MKALINPFPAGGGDGVKLNVFFKYCLKTIRAKTVD